MPVCEKRTFHGFTLIELLMAMAVLAVLLAIAAPSFRTFLVNSRLNSDAADVVADILYARSEAAARSRWIVVCPSSDGSSCSTGADWAEGRIIFADLNRDGTRDTDEPLLRTVAALPSSPTVAVSGFSTSYVTFSPYGGLFPSGNAGSLTICMSGYATGRIVSLGVNGRPVTSNAACP